MSAARVSLVVVAIVLTVGALVWKPSLAPTPNGGAMSAVFEDALAALGEETPYFGQSFGAAWGDANGDGYPDLWASGHSPQRLFVNNGDGRFTESAKRLVQPLRYSDRHNAAWADVDNDGDEDLVQLSGAGRGEDEDPNAFYLNEGGHLSDVADRVGLTYPLARARAALWFDLESNGRLDLLMTAAARPEAPPALFRSAADGHFVASPLDFLEASEVALLTSLTEARALHLLTGPPYRLFVHELRDGSLHPVGANLGLPELPGHWVADLLAADLDNDALPELIFVRGTAASDVTQPEPTLLHARLQSHQGRAQRIAFSGGDSILVQPYPRGKHWWGKGKLFIGADAHGPDDLPVRLSADDPRIHGLAKGDAGLFLGYLPDTARWIIELRDPDWNSVNLEVEGGEPFEALTTEGFSTDLRGLSQMIFWNDASGFAGPDTKTLSEGNCLGASTGDFDNDGDIDIYLVCSDYLTNAPNRLLENLGNRRFRLVPGAGGASGGNRGIGESVAAADYDLDGFLDLFVRNGFELPPFGKGGDQLFRNIGNGNHWLQIDLEGSESNRNGIGARVYVTAGGRRQARIADGGVHGRVQDFKRLHFGLGRNSVVDEVRVEWPSGQVTRHRQVDGDKIWVVSETGGIAVRGNREPQPSRKDN